MNINELIATAQEAFCSLNLVEIKGERNIVAMSRGMSFLKGVIEGLECMKEAQNNEANNKQG